MNVDDSNELRWIRIALEEHNTLIKAQNKTLESICDVLNKIYSGIP